MADRMEIKLIVPRWQMWFVWFTALAWVVLSLGLYWAEKRRGAGDVALLVLRLFQGSALIGSAFAGFATVLEVDGDDLVVTPLWRKLLRRTSLREPLDTVVLEWICGQLTMQRPLEGRSMPLGRGPKAREAADWLVARGVRPPVGG